MSQSSAKRLSVSRRRREVAELVLRSTTQADIAEKLGVSQATVSRDMEWLHKKWKAEALYDIELNTQRELQKLDRLENEAWEAWGRSQKPQQSADISGDQERPTRKRVRNQYGDPRFLAVINQCIIGRREILQLDKPRTLTDQEVDKFIIEEIERLASAEVEFRLSQTQQAKVIEYQPPEQPGGDHWGQNGAG